VEAHGRRRQWRVVASSDALGSMPSDRSTRAARKLVDVDYYIDVGGAAYGSLSESVRGTIRGRAFHGVFAELAAKFREFVDVLAEIRDSTRAADDHDILRLYEVWLKTGSQRSFQILKRLGVDPTPAARCQRAH